METQLKKPSTNSVGNWTPQEDEVILRYVYEKGKGDEHMMWGNLSETLNGRSGKSCRERWFNHLDPKIKRTEWSQEEQWVLFILRNQNNEKWSLISKRLMGRTDNAVKNYWNSRLKKRIDSMQHAVKQHFERKRKQKIVQMTSANNQNEEVVDLNHNSSMNDQIALLTKEQKFELSAYMERTKSEYLQKIIEQVNLQNVEYFENLACEYTLQLKYAIQNQQSKGSGDKNQESNNTQEITQIGHFTLKNDPLCIDDPISMAKKPEVIQMHLDILFKSVGFLSKHKIERILDDYKRAKDQKQREEEERLRIQMLLKKSRGRQAKNKCKLLEDSLQEHDSRLHNNQIIVQDGCHIGHSNNDIGHSFGDKYHSNGISGIKTSCFMTEERRTTILEANESDLQAMGISNQLGGHQQNGNIMNKDGNSQYNLDKKDMSMSDYEPSSAMSMNSDRSKQSRSLMALTRQFKKSRHSRAFRRIMRKLKNQKRLSRSIEKIFISKKEERTSAEINGDPLLIKPKKELEYHVTETQVVEKPSQIIEQKVINSEKVNTVEELKTKTTKTVEIENKATKEIQNSVQNQPNLSQKCKSGRSLRLKGTGLNQKSKNIKKSPKLREEDPKQDSNSNSNSTNGQCNSTTNIINNISNNNNNYNKNYNVTYSTVENITQNFYITLEHNHSPAPTNQAQTPQKETSPFNIPNVDPLQKQQSFTFQPSTSCFEQEQFQMPNMQRNQSTMVQGDQKVNETCHDFIINHQIDPITDGGFQFQRRSPNQFSNQQRSVSRNNRSRSNKSRGRKFATHNFFNQTMTQIQQGKNREMQPLVGNRRPIYPGQQAYNQPMDQYYETPKKEAQYAFNDELMNTQESSPFIKQVPVNAAPAPFTSYEDVPMRFSSPARNRSGVQPFGGLTSPLKVGINMRQIEENDYAPHTPQFQRPSMKMNLTVNHCQSAQPQRPFHESLVEAAPVNPFDVKVSSFDPEAELKPKLAPADGVVNFARRVRKFSMNENEFSNDILTKVNKKEGVAREVSPERKFDDFNEITGFDEYMATNFNGR